MERKRTYLGTRERQGLMERQSSYLGTRDKQGLMRRGENLPRNQKQAGGDGEGRENLGTRV